MKSILLGNGNTWRVYPAKRLDALEAEAGLDRQLYSKEDVLKNPECAADAEFIFSTWGMPQFTEEEIAQYFPKLKAIFYSAGTVQAFARPFLKRGVKIFSAWGANAVPVAEYTVAQILLANKGFSMPAAAVPILSPAEKASSIMWECPATMKRKWV